MSGAFKITLALHTPVVLPAAPPRLDALLHEASCRLHQDWTTPHELPLEFDSAITGYRASQVTFVTTPDFPLMARDYACVSSPEALDRHLVKKPPKQIKEGGGGFVRKLTEYGGLLCPYLAFYGEGDGDVCADYLELLDGIGRLHMIGAGSFSVIRVEPDDTQGWRRRSWPKARAGDAPSEVCVFATESLQTGQPDESVVRPKRIMREVMR